MSLLRQNPTHPLSLVIVSIIACAMVVASFAPLMTKAKAQPPPQARMGQPERGKPVGILEDLDTVKRRPNSEGRVIDAEPSTMRSPKNSLEPRNGRKVGDAWIQQQIGSNGTTAGNKTLVNAQVLKSLAGTGVKGQRRAGRSQRHHAAPVSPPPVLDDQYVQVFFQQALGRAQSSNELTYWTDILRAAYVNGQGAMAIGVREMGKTLFESAEYAVRNPNDGSSGSNCSTNLTNNCKYVYHLYKSYLMRDPDQPSWNNWASVVPTYGREEVRRGFDESGEFLNLMATVTPNGSATSAVSSLVTARLEPANQPGSGLVGRSADWGVSLLGLPGRAGLDLGLTLSYSSQVWTRSGPYIYFDEDTGFPSPGFRLGFPTIQEKYFDAKVGRNVYAVINSAGNRVELRQVGTSNTYEAGDSSYLQLTDTGGVLSMRSTDGTQFSYGWYNREYRCTQIKDRNGNYITINYDGFGHITTISDTLNRTITFEYDTNHNLLYIKQQRSGGVYTWASFSWDTITVQPNFTGISGIANGAQIPVLKKVGLADGSYYKFLYTSTNTGQVSRITRYGSDSNPAIDNHPLMYTTFDYGATDDPTRLTFTRLWAENWTAVLDVPNELVTEYRVNADGSYEVETPDARVYREFYGTGWKKGFVVRTEYLADGTTQLDKWTTTDYTQDNTSLSYPSNPRVTETNVYDSSNNRRRTTISYNSVVVGSTTIHLPEMVREYGGVNGDALKRRTVNLYRWDQAYMDRRVIGLVFRHEVYEGENQNTLVSMEEYVHDWVSGYMETTAPGVHHDTANYGSSFSLGRGILVAVFRYNASNTNEGIWTQTFGYNLAGQTTYVADALNHRTNINYTDSNGGSTLAYPTTVTDPDNFSSTAEYNYETGAVTKTLKPSKGTGQSGDPVQYLDQRMLYDSVGRLERVTTQNNGAYVRHVYGSNYVQSYAAVNNIADEAYSIQYVTGAGQPFHSASNHPNSTGLYKAQLVYYDKMGRVQKTSNPGEIYASWSPAGDDVAGWHYTTQTYDWQGRPLRTTNPDVTYKEAAYSGCGCAGGAVVTLTDEGTLDGGVAKRRQQKIYADVLGRTVKTELLSWSGGSPYATTVNTYNGRDQITQARQYAGPDTSSTYQDTVITYDGYGRLKTKHTPEQNGETTWNYNADDTVNTITDARNATTTLGYVGTNRHLVKTITHALSGSSTIVESFSYDAAGNRISMSDSSGATTYHYNQLSQLTSESRTFNGLGGSYTLGYEYHVGGQLKSLTDHTNQRINYAYDNAGRLNGLTGSNYTYGQFINSISYRAWGRPRQIAYGNGRTESVLYNSRLRANHYEIPAGGGYGAAVSVDYEYYNDGRLKHSHDLLDSRFNRSYEYDHVARLTKALSGAEADGQPATNDRPYKETATYDAFDHLNVRSSKHWSRALGFGSSDTYSNNRRVGWTYDANGNWLSGAGRQHTYDAAGRTSTTSWTSGGYFNEFFDGDGRRVKATEPNVVTYYLRSTVLGGQVVEELNSSGGKQKSFIYAGQKVIGYDWANGTVSLVHEDPSGVTVRSSVTHAAFVTYFSELDPWGAEVFTWDPYLEDPGFSGGRGESGPTSPGFGDISMPSTGCTLDGVYALCDFISRNLNGNGIRTEQLIAEEKPVKQPTIIPKGGQPNPSPVRTLVFVQHDLISFGLGLFGITVMKPGNEGGLDPRDMLVNINELVPQNPFNELLDLGKEELIKRMTEHKPCADVFGGLKKALKALNQLRFNPGLLDNGGIMEIKGNNVTVDTNRFTESGQPLPLALNIQKSTVQGHPSTRYDLMSLKISGKEFAAFAIGHELGHKRKIYGEYNNDGSSAFSNLEAGANNEKIRKACFAEFVPQPSP